MIPSSILDATDSLVIVTDIHSGTVVALNSAAENAIGLPRPQVVGRPLWEICPPHRTVWSSTFLTNPAGQRTHVVMTGVDVMEARETSGLFEQLMHSSTAIVLIGTDQGGRITFSNSGAAQVFETAEHDIVGRWLPAAAFGSGELRARIARVPRPEHARFLGVEISSQDRRGARQVNLGPLDRRSEARPPGRGASHEDLRRPRDWTVTHADGSRVITEMAVTPVTDALGNDAGYLLVGHDVTEQRRSKDLLLSRLAKEAEAAERLRELDRIKDNLVATVSHELRTPLTSILGYAELLTDEWGGPLTEQQREWTEAMERNGDRLLALIDDLLTVSTIDAGKIQPDSSPLDLRDVVSAARRALQPLFDGRRLTIRFHLPATPLIVQGDALQLERVVCSLMSNAVKFTEDGGTVECALAVEGSRARLTVSDDGIGIPENEQVGLFTRFFRATTATDRAIQGTGLGLSIAYSLVRSHGGEISVVSAPGRGTRVTVDLPIAAPRAAT